MQGSKDRDHLVTTYEAAKMLGCSMAWLERQRWKGEPPSYIKTGGSGGRMVRYRVSDLLDWIERNRVDYTTSEVHR